jgi:hypothetical protein
MMIKYANDQFLTDPDIRKAENMIDEIPPHFDEMFLHWFRERTEATWQQHRTKTIDAYKARNFVGNDWQQRTRWSGGLSEQEILDIEQRNKLRFPPDYRLFLQVLHSVDRPMFGARNTDNGSILPAIYPSFYNWQTDTEAIRDAYEWLVYGLVFDVQHDALWPESWGTKPDTGDAQEARVQELVNSAPKLIPVHAHRYLLAEPCQAGNLVLSIWQSDIIIYGDDLHDYYLHDFWDLLGLQGVYKEYRHKPEQMWAGREIPFWGELLYLDT